LQHDKALKAISAKLLKKAVDLLVSFNPEPEEEEELFSEDEDSEEQQNDGEFKSAYDKKVDIFNKFWKNFQKNIKLGMIEDHANREKLAVLTRWYTTQNLSDYSSFDDYIGRMKEGQKHIYYLGGEDREYLVDSPLIEKLVSEGYEVILGDDPLDETLFTTFKEYKTYKIFNVARTDFKEPYKTDELRKEVKYLKKVYTPLIEYAQKELKDHIKEVRISLRLVDSPVVIVADMMNDTPNRERLEAASSMKGSSKYHKEKNILEINPHSPIIQSLNKIVEVTFLLFRMSQMRIALNLLKICTMPH
jgi:heat shock protein beta